MQVYVLGCPLCQQQFKVSAGDLGKVLLCPHCRQPVRIPESFDPLEAKTKTAFPELSEWLPPKFDIPDPSKLRDRGTANKVLLPSADGGVQSIDPRLVTVEYKGKKYTLIALSPEQKKRRQFIVNLVSIVIAIIAIWATFKILTW